MGMRGRSICSKKFTRAAAGVKSGIGRAWGLYKHTRLFLLLQICVLPWNYTAIYVGSGGRRPEQERTLWFSLIISQDTHFCMS